MATGKALNGKPYAGNPHVRFDEGEVAPAATPRRGSLLYKKSLFAVTSTMLALGVYTLFARDARFADAPYMNPRLSTEERMNDLISKMEMREKVAVLCTTAGFKMYEIRDGEVYVTKNLEELYAKFPGCGLGSFFRADWFSGRNWKTGLRPEMLIKAYNAMQRYAVEKTRLGIPLALAGGQMLGETSIPTGIGIASTWDVELAREAARMNVRELRTFQQNYRVGFPQGTLALDPRWSRVEQTYGEDPFLAAEFVYARCAGSRDLGGGSVLESFICHGMGEGGHMSTPVHVGMNELLNVHMRPFEYAIKGGCSQFMTSYNLIDGIPALLRGDLVNGFVREKLGYKGTFIADAGAIGSLRWQGFARDLGEAAALAVKAGNDLCCWEAENYLNGLMQAIERRLITEEDINVSLRRVLRRRFESGLFEHPYIDPEARAKEYGRPEDVQVDDAPREQGRHAAARPEDHPPDCRDRPERGQAGEPARRLHRAATTGADDHAAPRLRGAFEEIRVRGGVRARMQGQVHEQIRFRRRHRGREAF